MLPPQIAWIALHGGAHGMTFARPIPMRNVVVEWGARVRTAPRVSVVIPAYRPEWLDAALDSVRRQTFEDWEIIVVDDGSPEPVTPACAEDVVLVRHENAGPGGARNRGVAHARGELIAFLDADDMWRPAKLARQVALHDAQPDLVMSCTDLVLTDGSAAPSVRSRGRFSGDRIPYERLFYENCIACSSLLVRREAFLRTPGMREHRRLGEDYELWLRLGRIGPIGYVEDTLLVRRRHESSLMSETLSDGSWFERERQVYLDVLRDHPDLKGKPFVKSALARLYWQAGWMHLARREWREARSALVRSISNRATRLRTWFDLARAVLRVTPLSTMATR